MPEMNIVLINPQPRPILTHKYFCGWMSLSASVLYSSLTTQPVFVPKIIFRYLTHILEVSQRATSRIPTTDTILRVYKTFRMTNSIHYLSIYHQMLLNLNLYLTMVKLYSPNQSHPLICSIVSWINFPAASIKYLSTL